MLSRDSNGRGARGQPQNRSRGSRGRGSASRGASSSSSTAQPTTTTDPFEQERLENAAKREKRGQNGTMINGRGGNSSRGRSNKQVRFAETPAEQTSNPFGRPPSPAANPFESATSNPFGASSQVSSTPATSVFGRPSEANAKTPSTNPFGKPSTNFFRTSSDPPSAIPPSNPFGKPSTTTFGTPSDTSSASPSNPFGNSSTSTFGAPSTFSSNPFGAGPIINGFPTLTTAPKSSQSSASIFRASPSIPPPTSAPFETSSGGTISNFGQPANFTSNPVGFPKPKPSKPSAVPSGSRFSGYLTQTNTSPPIPVISSNATAKKIDQLLRKEGIVAPKWPKLSPGDANFRTAIEIYWRSSKDYRNKVRASLIRAGLLDDPDKPKKLSEAIDFKGTCEEMCPDFERATRIYERDVKNAEMGIASDGQSYPAPDKMIKALARSAAGQDAPLPMDIRSPAALRRTLDYLFRSLLGQDEDNLPKVHHFLWDRTRAIRRDFVFQSSMSPAELVDQIYCLERITRFHVIALHQMSKDGIIPTEEFSEQQEVEQLGKALLSLVHAYEDCNIQGIECENEAEFRAYYVLFNKNNPGILETVQDWGWRFWGESNDIKTAVSLVETLQNTWDSVGPLKPHSAMDVAQNAFSRFFTIVQDKKVSYTMACFAEIHFNSVRKSILKTILAAYRKQRDQTKDWTLSKLNTYLKFDDENDIIAFGEAYGLGFEEVDGEDCLSFDSDGVSDPFPPLKQGHSYGLVEKKRGIHSLPEAIDRTVYGELEEEEELLNNGENDTEEEGLFVKDNLTQPTNKSIPPSFSTNKPLAMSQEQASTNIGGPSKTPSLFDRVSSSPGTFTPGLSAVEPKEQASLTPPNNSPSIFSKPPTAASLFPPKFDGAKQPETSTSAPSSFSPAFNTPSVNSPKTVSVPPTFSSGDLFRKSPEDSSGPSLPAGEIAPSLAPEKQPSSNLLGIPAISIKGDGKPNLSSSNAPTEHDPVASKSLFPSGSPQAFTPPSTLDDSSRPQQLNGQSILPQPSFNTSPSVPIPSQIQSPPIQNAAWGLSSGNASINGSQRRQEQPIMEQPQSQPIDRAARYDSLSQWVALGEDGIIDDFTSYTVEQILQETVKLFLEEEAEKVAREEEENSNREADEFRYRFLATKYVYFWRERAHHMWMKRKGREARQARREMAESMRASKAARSARLVDDFKASMTVQPRSSLESLLGATGVLDRVHDPDEKIRAIIHDDPPPRTMKRQRPENFPSNGESTGSRGSRHKRGRSDDPLRRSLLSDPTYLSGESRIHLMAKYGAQDENRRQVSGVQTDYFRLKARGIATLPDGTPLATSAARSILRPKRSLDELSRLTTPQHSRQSSEARSVPAKSTINVGPPRTSTERDEHIQVLKKRAKAAMEASSAARQKRNFDDDDEEALFARAKKIRQQMDEGSEWFRQEIERCSGSRSVS
ncbi:SAC3/GANP/Nin1/mts3/eIF-3 p25 family-domain-containing protein [Halenospora varia]|nr:SAC3/GANP/Nin1/mts3/eIF-3 p25 family-domain-containing protein [Halenospora varia]